MNASSRRTNKHWLFDYQREWLRWDPIAGLITAAVVISKAMAYATIAGLPVQVGLYTVLVPMTIYAIVGTNPRTSGLSFRSEGRNSFGR